jgi:hypothetical protein
MCEIQGEMPIRVFSVKLRVHSVKLCVELACFTGGDGQGK